LINYYYSRLNIIDAKIGQVLRFSALAFGAVSFIFHENTTPGVGTVVVFLISLFLLAISIGFALPASFLVFQHISLSQSDDAEQNDKDLERYFDKMSEVTAKRINSLRIALLAAVLGTFMLIIQMIQSPTIYSHFSSLSKTIVAYYKMLISLF
jgi:hypothetical protein